MHFLLVSQCTFQCTNIEAEKNWIRMPSIIYGTHVATTMIPIYGEILLGENQLESFNDKAAISLIYLPYLLLPLYLVFWMIAHEKPFGEQGSGKEKRN
jgi:hypothetical protein